MKNKSALIYIFLLLHITGCGTTAKFIYPDNPQALRRYNSSSCGKTVAVTPFEEMRSSENQSGTYFLFLVPFVPYGYGEYERPDAARGFNTLTEFDFDPDEDLAKAAAYSLRKSGLFEDAFFTYGGEKSNADYLLEGTIWSTKYRGNIYSYGLSIFGGYFWFFGLPIGTSQNDLCLSLKLTDLQTGNIIWKKKLKTSKKITQGIYYKYGHDVKGYSSAMEAIMNKTVREIKSALPNEN